MTSKLKEIFIINKDIDKEIKKAKYSVNYTKNTYTNMFNNIENIKDDNNNKISYLVKYEHINRKCKIKEKLNMFIIMANQ